MPKRTYPPRLKVFSDSNGRLTILGQYIVYGGQPREYVRADLYRKLEVRAEELERELKERSQ